MKRRKKMILIGGIFLSIIGIILIWFHIPYSPLKSEFKNDINQLIGENYIEKAQEVFTKDDFLHLPNTIQQYIEHCGYIGTEKMSYMKLEFADVRFVQNRQNPSLLMSCTQYNFVQEPARMALLESSLYSIPFEGYDSYWNNKGGMKGVIAKAVPLFNQTGADMDKACLVTFLAECLLVPTSLLQDYIAFEEITDLKIKATISHNDITSSGVFTFNEQYEMISFTTNDRAITKADGSMEYTAWSAICEDYTFNQNGIKHPRKFQAVWNYPEEDFIYFAGLISKISYDAK